MIKISLGIIVLALTIVTSLQVYFVYYNNVKVETAFEGAANHLSSLSELEMRDRLPNLFIIAQVHSEELPESFFENLMVKKENGKFRFASEYHITVWVLGEPEILDASEAGEDGSLIDNLRRKARIDFDFSPHAETP